MRCRGSTISRRQSPSKLNVKTANISAIPGKKASHHSPETIKFAPSATMIPHSAVGGRTPKPINDRPAAFNIAHHILREACTIIGGNVLGYI